MMTGLVRYSKWYNSASVILELTNGDVLLDLRPAQKEGIHAWYHKPSQVPVAEKP